VFSCAGARTEAPFRPLGESGWRGRLETPRGSIDAICWSERASIGELSATGEPLRLHYRISRSRWSGRTEVEIVAAWSAESREPGPDPLPLPVSRFPAPAAT
jgi:hypothetical protein